MKKHIPKIITFAAIAGLALVAHAINDSSRPGFPLITRQPLDQAVLAGSRATFSAQAVNGAVAYQWLRNGVPLEGQTKSTLILENTAIQDAGYYSCDVSNGEEAVPTRAALLNVYTMSGGGGGPITVYGLPVVSGSSQGSCPGAYAGYVLYTKTIAQGWGWAPTSGTTVHTAADGTVRTDTKIVYNGKNVDWGCNQTSVTVPDPTYSPKYRFAIYFPSNVPTNSYPITLGGFDP